jgi:hypothetical protein
MAGAVVQFPNLPASTALSGAEIFAIVQGSVSRRTSLDDIVAFVRLQLAPQPFLVFLGTGDPEQDTPRLQTAVDTAAATGQLLILTGTIALKIPQATSWLWCQMRPIHVCIQLRSNLTVMGMGARIVVQNPQFSIANSEKVFLFGTGFNTDIGAVQNIKFTNLLFDFSNELVPTKLLHSEIYAFGLSGVRNFVEDGITMITSPRMSAVTITSGATTTINWPQHNVLGGVSLCWFTGNLPIGMVENTIYYVRSTPTPDAFVIKTAGTPRPVVNVVTSGASSDVVGYVLTIRGRHMLAENCEHVSAVNMFWQFTLQGAYFHYVTDIQWDNWKMFYGTEPVDINGPCRRLNLSNFQVDTLFNECLVLDCSTVHNATVNGLQINNAAMAHQWYNKWHNWTFDSFTSTLATGYEVWNQWVLSRDVTISTASPAIFTTPEHDLTLGDLMFLQTAGQDGVLPEGVVSFLGYSVLSIPTPNTFTLENKSVVTITIATPGVVTWSDHNLQADWEVTFTTTGALPTGLTAGTTYYALPIDGDTLNVALTPGGLPIDTSGTQSGVHTGHHTVFSTGLVPPGTVPPQDFLGDPIWQWLTNAAQTAVVDINKDVTVTNVVGTNMIAGPEHRVVQISQDRNASSGAARSSWRQDSPIQCQDFVVTNHVIQGGDPFYVAEADGIVLEDITLVDTVPFFGSATGLLARTAAFGVTLSLSDPVARAGSKLRNIRVNNITVRNSAGPAVWITAPSGMSSIGNIIVEGFDDTLIAPTFGFRLDRLTLKDGYTLLGNVSVGGCLAANSFDMSIQRSSGDSANNVISFTGKYRLFSTSSGIGHFDCGLLGTLVDGRQSYYIPAIDTAVTASSTYLIQFSAQDAARLVCASVVTLTDIPDTSPNFSQLRLFRGVQNSAPVQVTSGQMNIGGTALQDNSETNINFTRDTTCDFPSGDSFYLALDASGAGSAVPQLLFRYLLVPYRTI